MSPDDDDDDDDDYDDDDGDDDDDDDDDEDDDDQQMVNGEVDDEATQAVHLVKENIDCDKTMKRRTIMVSVNKMLKLYQAVNLVKSKLETRWPDSQWDVTHFRSFSIEKKRKGFSAVLCWVVFCSFICTCSGRPSQ